MAAVSHDGKNCRACSRVRLHPGPVRRSVLLLALGLGGCLDPAAPGNLVPATADEDPRLPQVELEVAGHPRAVHVVTMGDPDAPPLLLAHGTYSDARALLPLGERLAEAYFVVAWDQRGAGLSERITAEEFSLDAAVEEIDALRTALDLREPVTLVGHSWGGGLAALYTARRPTQVAQVAMLEPMPFDGDWMDERAREVFSFDYFNEVWNDQARFDALLAAADHEALDARAALTLDSGLSHYFCDRANIPPWPIWRVGGYLEWARSAVLLEGRHFRYSFVEGIEAFTDPVLIIGGECGGLNAAFQARQAVEWPNASVVEIPGTGHRLAMEDTASTFEALADYLEAFER